MNFFMYSKCGEGAGLMKRLKEEGNDCAINILEDDYSDVYDGILPKERAPKPDAIVIFDSSGMGARADRLRESGFSIFGGSKFHDRLECDRDFGLEFMTKNDIRIPETTVFADFATGIDFIRKNSKKRYVFKPSGKSVPAHLTYVGSDAEDLIIFMGFVEKNYFNDIDDFILQEFVEGSIISSEYWVGANGFIEPINHTVEAKKFMNDDIGPSTGCSGNLVWFGEESTELARLLRHTEIALMQEGFLGPIDINCIVNEKGIYGLEWTPRFGLDAMPSLLAALGCDIGEVISDAVQGVKTQMDFRSAFSGGIRITIPPYPIEPESIKSMEKLAPNKGIPIRGLEGPDCEVYFYEVKLDDELLVHSSGTGVIACVSSTSDDSESCFDFPLDVLNEAKIPDKQYRTDLGSVLPEMHRKAVEVLDAVWS